MQAKFEPGKVLDKMPQPTLHKARKAFLRATSAFNNGTPREMAANFATEESTEGKEQLAAFLRSCVFPHAVLRRLYPGKEGAGDKKAETSALHARLEAVLKRPRTIFGLWNEARDAAADVYLKSSRKQRVRIYEEEVKAKRAGRARYFAERGYYGRAVKALLGSPTFDPLDSDVMQRLRDLHPDASEPARRLPRHDSCLELPPAPTLSETKLRKTANKMDETSAVDPDRM